MSYKIGDDIMHLQQVRMQIAKLETAAPPTVLQQRRRLSKIVSETCFPTVLRYTDVSAESTD